MCRVTDDVVIMNAVGLLLGVCEFADSNLAVNVGVFRLYVCLRNLIVGVREVSHVL